MTHVYDPAGNRTVKVDGGARVTWTYDAADQLQTQRDATGPTTFTYDGAGNLAVRNGPTGRTTYTWDGESCLTAAKGLTFTYNGDGQRVRRQDATASWDQIWDGQNLVFERPPAKSELLPAWYALEPATYGHLLSRYDGSATLYYHYDGLGSADRLTDATGATKASYQYDAYGTRLASTGKAINPFTYIGRLGYYYDSSLDMYHLRAREYSPLLARFTTIDPIGVEAHYPNRYSYVLNAPTNLLDPSGLQPQPGVPYSPTSGPGDPIYFTDDKTSYECKGERQQGDCILKYAVQIKGRAWRYFPNGKQGKQGDHQVGVQLTYKYTDQELHCPCKPTQKQPDRTFYSNFLLKHGVYIRPDLQEFSRAFKPSSCDQFDTEYISGAKALTPKK